jgi:hypothetical protein
VHAAVFALALASAIEIQGDAECPSPAAVSAHLRSLLPETATVLAEERVLIQNESEAVTARLVDTQGRIVAEQRIVERGPCDELAEAIAVVVAAWAADLQPGVVPPPEATPRPVLEVTASPAEPAPPSISKWTIEVGVGVGVLGVLAANEVVAGAVAEAFIAQNGSPLALRVAAARSAHEGALAGARFGWSDLLFSAAPAYRIVWRERWLLDVYTGVAANLTTAKGRGYSVDRQSVGISPAGTAGVRLAARFGWIAPWFGATGTTTLQKRAITVAGSVETQELPRTGLWLGVGFAAGSWQ